MEIENCNICGEPPEVVQLETGAFRIRCNKCLSKYDQTTWAFKTKEEAIPAWNRMMVGIPLPPPPKRVKK